MRVSVVIPVWNGADVLSSCLDALYAHSGDERLEVICVDNASSDESAAIIADRYPHARLIRQPVNLGFGGGVNAGMEVARGDVFVLLNQDCVVQPGWLGALARALDSHPEFGIAGCTIFNPDGSLNHAGAHMSRPDAYGVHLTDLGDGRPHSVDYVTGAAFAIRRHTWNVVGRFDEGYYPAYYEECDYCYRARLKGIETAYVPEAQVQHLSSSREWQADPIKHWANQHRSRYRFVCKHFDSHEVGEFLEAEVAAVEAEQVVSQAVGRFIAARDTLRGFSDIMERRRLDLGDDLAPADRRLLQVGFTQVLRRSFSVAEALAPTRPAAFPAELSEEWQMADRRLQLLKQREYDLLTRIYFRPPSADRAEPPMRRLIRWFVLRPLSFLTGREHLLLAELNTVHVARMDQMEHMSRLFQAQWQHLDRRLGLLEILTDYDYR